MKIKRHIKNLETFQSDDISLVAFLLTEQDVSLLEIKEDRLRHFVFILSNSTKCNELKQQYLNNVPAPARELFANREMLISEIKRKSTENKIYE